MPAFALPWLLVLLPLAPVAAYAWLRRRRTALRFGQVGLAPRLPAGRSHQARLGGAILRGAGIAAVIVALAGPRWPDPGTRLPAEGIAVVMVLDVSGSMAEREFLWTGEPI